MKRLYKKLLLIPICVFIGLSAFAQVGFGIKGGLNLANLKYEARDESNGIPNAKSLQSFQAGIIVDFSIGEWFSFQPGMMLTGKGSKVKYSGTLGTFTQKVNPIYIEVPANILFKPSIGTNTRVYFGAGPYIALGIAGRSSSDAQASIGSYYTDHKLKFGNGNNDDLKRIDIGGNVLAGLEFGNSFMVGAQYGMSLINNAPGGNNDAPNILKNKVFSITAGLIFR